MTHFTATADGLRREATPFDVLTRAERVQLALLSDEVDRPRRAPTLVFDGFRAVPGLVFDARIWQ